MIKFIRENKDWVFSGIGLAILGGIFQLLKYIYAKNPDASIFKASISIIIILIALIIFFNFYRLLQRKNFNIFLKNKIKESANLLLDDRKNKLPISIQYNCFESYAHHKKIIEVFKEIVCTNQGELVEFVYEAGELHKPIKIEINKSENDRDIKYLSECCNRLETEIKKNTDKLYSSTYEKVLEYFDDRSEQPPRICIKGFNEGRLEDIFRRPMEDYLSDGKVTESDKGSLNVFEQGYAFLENNIPLQIKKGNYFNSRINSIEVANSLDNNNEFKNFDDWMKCWKDIIVTNPQSGEKKTTRPSPSSCYMSTLIIPMTLLRNSISKEIKKHFEIPKIDEKDKCRAIYGLLCFDHTQKNFFNPETDISAGYIFADLFSLYLIYGLMYTKYSESFKKAKGLLI